MTDPKSPYHASFLKIQRAQRHIKELEDIIHNWILSGPVRITSEIETREIPDHPGLPLLPPGKKRMVAGIKFHFNSDPAPEEMSAIIGDIFHNLRSALDLMACQMARDYSGDDSNVHFPFAGSESGLDEQIKEKRFYKCGPEAEKLLKDIKPFKGGDIALRAIHDLNVRDKHQTLIPQSLEFASPIIDTHAKDVASMIVGDPSKPSVVKLIFPNDCALAQQELVPTLHDLVEAVTRVIEAFELLRAPAGEAPVSGNNNG